MFGRPDRPGLRGGEGEGEGEGVGELGVLHWVW